MQRLGIIGVAKQASFSLYEVGVPEVDELIERARAMRDWLAIAEECGCESLKSCGLFDS